MNKSIKGVKFLQFLFLPSDVTHPILGVHLGVDPGLKRKKKVKKKSNLDFVS